MAFSMVMKGGKSDRVGFKDGKDDRFTEKVAERPRGDRGRELIRES